MRTILVTRPTPAGDALVKELRDRNYQAYYAPLITITAGQDLAQLPAQFLALNRAEYVIAVSQYAIDYANIILQRIGQHWRTDLHYYAVGKATASALQRVSQCSVVYPIEDTAGSEALLSLLNSAASLLRGKQVLILRGNGGLEQLKQTLTNWGGRVIYCECYRRVPCNYNENQIAQWIAASIDTVIITSGEILQQLWKTVPACLRKSWLLKCQLVVVSKRLAQQAIEQGWHYPIIAAGADNAALIQAVQLLDSRRA